MPEVTVTIRGADLSVLVRRIEKLEDRCAAPTEGEVRVWIIQTPDGKVIDEIRWVAPRPKK